MHQSVPLDDPEATEMSRITSSVTAEMRGDIGLIKEKRTEIPAKLWALIGVLSTLVVVLAIVAIAAVTHPAAVAAPVGQAAVPPATIVEGPSSATDGSPLGSSRKPLGLFGPDCEDQKYSKDTFLLSLGGGTPVYDFMGDDGLLAGFSVELVNEVSKAANADIRAVHDQYSNCWDGGMGAKGLLGKWVDGCVGWYNTIPRENVYTFSEPWSQLQEESFLVRTGYSMPAGQSFAGQKIGLLKGWFTDKSCLVRKGFTDIGYDSGKVASDAHLTEYKSIVELAQAIKDSTVDIGFIGSDDTHGHDITGLEFAAKHTSSCARGGMSVMTRKDSRLEPVWNRGFDIVKTNGVLTSLCEKWKKVNPDLRCI